MTGVRRALLFSTADRYFGIAVNFAMIAVVSRLLSPAEIGVSAVGLAIVTFALALRDFASSGFLIQHKDMTRQDVRTLFTILLALTVLISAGLFASASWLATFFGEDGLEQFLHVIAVALVIEAIALPTTALLRRELAFGTLAIINVSVAAASTPVTIGLAALGFSYMSMAWSWLFSAALTTALAIYFRPNLWIYRPTLCSWRSVLAFGSFGGANTLLAWMNETLPQLVLGRVLPVETVGLYNRALLICSLPDKVVLTGVSAVATPALAAEVREGRSIKQAYLQSLGYITVVHWPALVVLFLLSDPAVEIVLGRQWLGIVPVVRLLALASLFRFPSILTSSMLVAVGAIHHTFRASLISLPISALLLCLASPFGVVAMAATQLITVPLQTLVALHFIRIHVHFRWRELAAAVRQSAFVTFCSAVGPAAVIVVADRGFDLTVAEASFAALLSAAGWIIGVGLSRHQVLTELRRIARAVAKAVSGPRSTPLESRLDSPLVDRSKLVNAGDL